MQSEECRVQNRLNARNRAVWQPRAILHPAFYTLHLEWWEVLVMLQFVASDTYFVTLDLQSSSRNTSL